MRDSVRKVNHYSMLIPDRPGAAFGVLATLVSAGINLLGCTGSPRGRRAQIDVVPDDTRKFLAAARRAGLAFTAQRSGFLIQGEDRPGALADNLKVLADGKINVTAVDAVSAGGARFGAIFWVDARDVNRAGRVLRARVRQAPRS